MIKYKFGERYCDISFDKFLSLIYNDSEKFKSDFENFSVLYEFMVKNINDISKMLFDGYEYYLEKGVLHNLYGPALVKYCDDKQAYFQGTSNWFYIDGKLIQDDIGTIDRGCKKLEDFKSKEIFHYKDITGKKSYRDILTGKWYRRIEGVDYEIYKIDLQKRIESDQRKKKLLYLNDK